MSSRSDRSWQLPWLQVSVLISVVRPTRWDAAAWPAACTIRQLAQIRGGYRYIAKLEEHPQRGQMLVGFLRAADEPPVNAGAELAASAAVDLEQFGPVCDRMK